MNRELHFTPFAHILHAERTIERLCIAGIIFNDPSEVPQGVKFRLLEPKEKLELPVMVRYDDYELTAPVDWKKGDALVMIFVSNEKGKITSTGRNSYIWRLPLEAIQKEVWAPINYKRGMSYENLNPRSQKGGMQLKALAEAARTVDLSSLKTIHPTALGPLPEAPPTPMKQILEALNANGQRPVGPYAMLVYWDDPVERNEQTVVTANDYSSGEFTMAFWNDMRSEVNRHGNCIYLSSITCAIRTDRFPQKIYVNVRDGIVRAATAEEKRTLDQREGSKTGDDIMSQQYTGDQRSIATIKQAMANNPSGPSQPPTYLHSEPQPRYKNEGHTEQQHQYHTQPQYQPAQPAQQPSRPAPPPPPPPPVQHQPQPPPQQQPSPYPYQSPQPSQHSQSSYPHSNPNPNLQHHQHHYQQQQLSPHSQHHQQQQPPRPSSYSKSGSIGKEEYLVRHAPNPNVVFHLENQLDFTSIYYLHANFQKSPGSVMNSHICGEVRQYEPADTKKWLRKGNNIRFVLYMNDETTLRDLPVIFEGKPAKEFLDIPEDCSDPEEISAHIDQQLPYVSGCYLDLAVQVQQQVLDGVLVTQFLGYGSQISPSLKRKHN